MAAYRRVDGFKSPVHRDQLRAQRSVTSMGEPFHHARYHDATLTLITRRRSTKRRIYDAVNLSSLRFMNVYTAFFV